MNMIKLSQIINEIRIIPKKDPQKLWELYIELKSKISGGLDQKTQDFYDALTNNNFYREYIKSYPLQSYPHYVYRDFINDYLTKNQPEGIDPIYQKLLQFKEKYKL